jgi:hypothetical protein
MSKIPTLPSSGSQRSINIAGSNPNGGMNPSGTTAMKGWNPHDAVAASGQLARVPDVGVAAPQNSIPGKPLHYPARSAPETIQAAGRNGAADREDGRGGQQ